MRTLRLAHRGEWRYAPENTIRALELALDLRSCDGLEFDVRLSRDGVPVLLHDLTLMRVQGVPDAVVDLDAAALADLGVPPLSDVLATIDDSRPDAFLDVELKGVDHGPPTAEVLLASRGPAPHDAIVSSFEPATLEAMRDLLPRWGRWLNTRALSDATIRQAIDLGCTGVSARHESIDPATFAEATDAGLEVAGWTVRDLGTWSRLAALGVRAVCVEAEALDG
jgi:glycerophosphoryl diester phosphodiesterase